MSRRMGRGRSDGAERSTMERCTGGSVSGIQVAGDDWMGSFVGGRWAIW